MPRRFLVHEQSLKEFNSYQVIIPFQHPLKTTETKVFKRFQRGIRREHWPKMLSVKRFLKTCTFSEFRLYFTLSIYVFVY